MTFTPAEALAHLEKDLVFIDCEMTGGDPERHDIIEIGAVRTSLTDLTPARELAIKVAPRTTRGTSQDSLRIAGYSAKEWKSALAADEALRQLAEFAAGGLLVGWATYNDLLFISAAATRHGVDVIPGDTYFELQDWAQARLRFQRSPGLQPVANQLKIVRDAEHSAIEDALVTYEVFRMLWRYGPEDLEQTLASLTWESYAELTGAIILDPTDAAARRAEAARYVVADTSWEALLTRRGGYKRT